MSDARAVADLVRSHDRFVVACHENPDGDALGSLLGLSRSLSRAGYDVVAWAPGSTGLPSDYAWLDLADVQRTVPEDIATRLLIAVDCGCADRLGAGGGEAVARAAATANIDHHADNTRFGDAVWVEADAPCASVMVRRLLVDVGLPITPDIATLLYVGLVTDTGHFRYENAGVEAHRAAIALIEEGAQPAAVARALHDGHPIGRVRLLGRALSRLEVRADGRLATTWITVADLEELDASEEDTEGIVNHLRGIGGVDVAAFLREPRDSTRGRWKGSLRSGRPEIDVAEIAHRFGGGGHRQAAGFSSDAPLEELLEDLARAVDDIAA